MGFLPMTYWTYFHKRHKNLIKKWSIMIELIKDFSKEPFHSFHFEMSQTGIKWDKIRAEDVEAYFLKVQTMFLNFFCFNESNKCFQLAVVGVCSGCFVVIWSKLTSCKVQYILSYGRFKNWELHKSANWTSGNCHF